ncbi:hypothetical protein BDV19DRAFT_154846 [Aspergillus venezuelensis]
MKLMIASSSSGATSSEITAQCLAHSEVKSVIVICISSPPASLYQEHDKLRVHTMKGGKGDLFKSTLKEDLIGVHACIWPPVIQPCLDFVAYAARESLKAFRAASPPSGKTFRFVYQGLPLTERDENRRGLGFLGPLMWMRDEAENRLLGVHSDDFEAYILCPGMMLSSGACTLAWYLVA